MEKAAKAKPIPQKPLPTPRTSIRMPTFPEQAFAHPPKLAHSWISEPEGALSMHGSAVKSSAEESAVLEPRAFPQSDLMASTVIASSESEEPSLEYLQAKKELFALIWLDFIQTLGFVTWLYQAYYYSDYSWLGMAFFFSYTALFSIQTIIIIACHFKAYRKHLWIPFIILSIIYFIMDWNYAFSTESLLRDGASEEAIEFFNFVTDSPDYFTLIAFFQNTLIIVHFLESLKSKRNALGLVIVLTVAFEFVSYSRIDFPDSYEAMKSGFSVFLVLNVLILDVLFFASVFNLQKIQRALYRVELEENRKFKQMFNAIQDGVILLEGQQPKFINSLAFQIIDEAIEESSGDFSLSVADQPIFYPFSTGSEPKIGNGIASSLMDLMSQDAGQLSEVIFTTSRAISQCTRMDQVHKIIEKQEGRKSKSFYSIRYIKVATTSSSKTDEVMIQISDISSRVQSQYMKLERQYLSLMNSTVSHEMRNPLNAMVSQIAAQESRFRELRNLIEDLPKDDNKDRMACILKESYIGMTIAKSSTKLLRFNVEDILALPQLKQGRFTKNFSLIDLRRVVAEVSQIMDFQAREKGVAVTTEFEGFLESSKGEILINLDEQRFQQVLLNYLSNGLKFTERNGEILILLTYIPPVDISQAPSRYSAWQAKTTGFWQSKAEPASQLYCSESLSDHSSESGSKMSSDQINEYIQQQQQEIRAIFASELSPKLVVSVIDTGIGIKVEEQTRLFKLFGTIKRTRAVNTRGVGLGLSISKMICEEFGGAVSLKSQEGMGSAFLGSFVLDSSSLEVTSNQFQRTSLSIQVEAQRRSQAARASIKPQIPLTDSQSLIYIVDDEAYNCEVLKLMIKSIGIPHVEERLRLYMSGTEALCSVRKELKQGSQIRVFLTDLSMPIMDGYKLIDKVKREFAEQQKPLPLITALTGHTETEFISKAYKKGADHVYSKPVCVEQIKMVLLEAGVLE